MLVWAQQDIFSATVGNTINASRKIAGFPEISEELLTEALKRRKGDYAKATLRQITGFEHPGNIMTGLVKEFSDTEIEE